MRVDDYRAVRYPRGRRVHLVITGDRPACGARGAVYAPEPVDIGGWRRVPFCRPCFDAARGDLEAHRDRQADRIDAAHDVCELLIGHDWVVPRCVEIALQRWIAADADIAARLIERRVAVP